MTEDFLHYVWKYRLFAPFSLATTEGDTLTVSHPGHHNNGSGPDFFNARIKLGSTEWAGNVEIHVRASDWIKHMHQSDTAYDSVILHVVYEDDAAIKRSTGELIPVLTLKNRFDPLLLDRYKKLLANKSWVACEKAIAHTDKHLLNIWLEKLVVQRLMRKAESVSAQLNLNNNNWEDTFMIFLCRNFGFKINAEPFEMLARNLPLHIIGKHRNTLFQIEALLFGQAGLLNLIFADAYPNALQNEYNFLSHKYNLKPMNASQWHLMRLRPYNFPHVRLAQLAALCYRHASLFSKVLDAEDTHALSEIFRNPCSPYWETHFLFDKTSKKKTTVIGEASVQNIIINTVVLFLMAWGIYNNEDTYRNKAVEILSNLPPENNSICSKWAASGIAPRSASESQALIELKTQFCARHRCLECMVGDFLLRHNDAL